jgi:protocatechuate 3,4-dioxygenase beta subunit
MRRPRSFQWVTRNTRALLVACQATADATRGPLYRHGAPWRTRLCPIDEPGEPLSITGIVTSSGDCRPIANATLDIWQTNARGLYSNLFGLENPSDPGAFNLRGRLQSGHDGIYRFESIVPGRYPLFWPLTRPRHIHVIATHPQHEALTTQSVCSVTCRRPMIRKLKSGEYRVYSRKVDPRTGRRRNLGTFGTRAAAEKHERAVQFFKRRG